MNFLIGLKVLLIKLFHLPEFMAFVAKDKIEWYKDKGWNIFEGWGLHIYTGKFGAGKSSSVVHDAYLLAKKFPQLTILTNFKLMNFPEHTQILPLKCPQDILNAPPNTLVLIDEIGTIFNSRDFAKGKGSVPKILFQHLCQCRKKRMMIYATAPRFCFVDKQLRDIAATVRTASVSFAHPFSRMCTVRMYDAHEFDMAYSNPMLPLTCLNGWVYIQTDALREAYDTDELVNSMLSADYISDEEILRNRGETTYDLAEVSGKAKRTYRQNRSREG